MSGTYDRMKPGTLVWAKKNGTISWPAVITKPGDMKKPEGTNEVYYCVYFFGSGNYDWIENYNINGYSQEYNANFESISDKPDFKKACQLIAKYQRYVKWGIPILSQDETVILPMNYSPEIDDPVVHTPRTSPTKPLLRKIPTFKNIRQRTAKRRTRRSELDNLKTWSDIKIGSGVRQQPEKIVYSVVSDSESQSMAKRADSPHANTPVSVEPNVVPEILIEAASPFEKIGFLGVEYLDGEFIRNLMKSGKNVSVWNNIAEKCTPFVDEGAFQVETVQGLLHLCDVIFLCISDSDLANKVVFGDDGIVGLIATGKSVVNMTTFDSEVSMQISEALKRKGCRYLEAVLHGGISDAKNSSLFVIAAGDASLYMQCQQLFNKMASHSVYFDTEGAASKINVVLQVMIAGSLAAFTEGLALAERIGIQSSHIIEIMKSSILQCPLFINSGENIANYKEGTNFSAGEYPLQNLRKFLGLGLSMGNALNHSMPMAAVSNEFYKRAHQLSDDDADAGAVYMCTRY